VGFGVGEAAVAFPLVISWVGCPVSASGAAKAVVRKEKNGNTIHRSIVGEFMATDMVQTPPFPTSLQLIETPAFGGEVSCRI
jgi:hypothetical protein